MVSVFEVCVPAFGCCAGAWAAIDCVGGKTFTALLTAVRPGGTAIAYGAMEVPACGNSNDLLQ